MIMVFFSFFILVIFWQNFVGGKVHCLLSMYGNCMKHNSYQSHFQTKQLPAGQHGKFTWPTWTHCEICGGIFHPHRNSRLCGFLLKWVDFVWENLLDISKCDHTFTLTYKALQTAHSSKERLQFWMVEVNNLLLNKMNSNVEFILRAFFKVPTALFVFFCLYKTTVLKVCDCVRYVSV